MHLIEIRFNGFKCYQHPTKLTNLSYSFNAITGMNGSGKSNIIDAILFALGLDTPKLLRTTNQKELINHQCKQASVTLIFSNKDKQRSPVGYSYLDTIELTRSIENDGKTRYTLNGHNCSSATVSKLMASVGISRGSTSPYFVIMQGHITKILSMKSKELGSLIEETAGIRSYVQEKEKALATLARKECKLREASDSLRRQISPFFGRLKEERKAYIEKRNLEERKEQNEKRIKEINTELCGIEMAEKLSELKELFSKIQEQEEELRKVTNKLDKIRVDSKNVFDEVKIRNEMEEAKLKLERIAMRDKELAEARALVEEFEEDVGLEERLDELKEKERLLEKEIKRLEMCDLGVKSNASSLSDRIKELSDLKIKKGNLNSQLGSIKASRFNNAEIKTKIQEIESLKNKNIEEMKGRLERMRNQYPISMWDDDKIIKTKSGCIYGTVEENFIITNSKYKEAVMTVLGSKGKYIIVENENVGSDLFKDNSKRINVIPLNKIKPRNYSMNIIKQVVEMGGVNAMNVIEFKDPLVQPAMEFIFNGFFIFEKKEIANKACFKFGVTCVTLEGVVYDPRGTLTGGKINYKSEIIRREEMVKLHQEIVETEKRMLEYRNKEAELYNLKEMLSENEKREKLSQELRKIENKIKTLEEFSERNNHSYLKSEIDGVRKEINLLIRRKAEYDNKKRKMEKIVEEIKKLEASFSETERDHLIKAVDRCEKMLREEEVNKSRRTLDEKDEAMLLPRKNYLMSVIAKLQTKINRILDKIGEKEINNEWLDNKLREFSNYDCKRKNELLEEMQEIKNELERFKNIQSISMDPKNFDLLEKNEETIKNLEVKVATLERDRIRINNAISKLDNLSKTEMEKAFVHLNQKIGDFLRFFIKDSDAKIVKEEGPNENIYDLKVKIGNWKDSLNELSGGQRSLVALSLIFSMLTYRPAPFYIFDEVDSALDLSFTQGIGEIIRKEFKNSQFLVVSLKDGMYDNADRLYQVYVQDGRSNIRCVR
ncbi:Structural maintenance of chromosomes protein 2 [Astathelohania contejeani]|uniref:Structural maintenance of chromosomes protein 2 n=1 Tax=Astathelohania contejeani TaxID=164912 RepID=A0ABQ7I0Q9_9MICR|nr:Structural maintenance of chromosomes protein 2 [Thelohania contejeani]